MNDIWVCSQCNSVNRQRSGACYKCKAPQTAATGAMADQRVESAIVNRTVVAYRRTTLLFLLAATLILAVAAAGILILIASLADVDFARDQLRAVANGGTVDDAALAARSARLVVPQMIHLGLVVAAVIFFAAWLSRVISNIPALGGGLPGTTPTKAFIYPLIPIWNLFKVPGMIQDALYRLEPQAGGFFMILFAWFGLVGSWFVSIIANIVIAILLARDVGRAIEAGSRPQVVDAAMAAFDRSVAVEIAAAAMVAIGAVILVLVMARIERRSRARDAEVRAQLTQLPLGA